MRKRNHPNKCFRDHVEKEEEILLRDSSKIRSYKKDRKYELRNKGTFPSLMLNDIKNIKDKKDKKTPSDGKETPRTKASRLKSILSPRKKKNLEKKSGTESKTSSKRI